MRQNVFKQVWHLLSRLNVAAVLMLMVLLLTALGSCFPQLALSVSVDPERQAAWESTIQARYGPLAELLAVVGVFQWFSSPIFLTSVALLLLATLVCTLDRWQAVWRRARRTPLNVTAIPFDRAPYTATLSVSPGSTAADVVIEPLEAEGFRVQAIIVANVIYLRADRNRLARLATLVTHLAILLLFLGAGLSRAFAWQTEVTIGPGQVVEVDPASQVALRNEGFAITRHYDGSAADYEARVIILNRDQAMKLGIIKLNQPLTYDGMKIYLQGYGGNEAHHDVTLLVGRDPGYGLVVGLSGDRWWEWSPPSVDEALVDKPPSAWSIEARYYTSFSNDGTLNCLACHETSEGSLPVSYCHIPHIGSYVQCNLCPRRCVIAAGERGHCRVRENRGGKLYSMVYGNPCAVHVDPIEKKPFYHFLPTAAAFSLATAGCNLRCLYCQNWTISQVPPEQTDNIDLPPEAVVRYALRYKAPVIAYTYSEPTLVYEDLLTTARLAREVGLRNVIISAGFINPEPLQALCETVDANKIDLKGYDEAFYQEVCDAKLGPVLEAIQTIYRSGTHLEIVNLVVPTLNDDLEQLRALAHWLARDLSPDVPLHFSRFQPQYKLTNLPPTPVERIEQAREIAMEEGVRFVYAGNVPGHPGNNTYCPTCGAAIIVRRGFAVTEYNLQGGVCAHCGEPIPGVWWPDQPEGEPVEVPPGPPDH